MSKVSEEDAKATEFVIRIGGEMNAIRLEPRRTVALGRVGIFVIDRICANSFRKPQNNGI